jgi:hypothetical protein
MTALDKRHLRVTLWFESCRLSSDLPAPSGRSILCDGGDCPMSSDLPYEPLTTVSDLIRRKRSSSAEVTGDILQRIARVAAA